jgi:copper chaperone CopZ
MNNALIVAGLVLMSAKCCCVASHNQAFAADAPMAQEAKLSGRVMFQIKGMTCPVCIYGVKKQLKKIPGVITASVDYKAGTGLITLKPGAQVMPEDVRKAIKKAGFDASNIRPATTAMPVGPS